MGIGNPEGAQTPEESEAQEKLRSKEVTLEAIARLLEDLAENASTDAHSEWFFKAADKVRECA
jgi:hypothetical protein